MITKEERDRLQDLAFKILEEFENSGDEINVVYYQFESKSKLTNEELKKTEEKVKCAISKNLINTGFWISVKDYMVKVKTYKMTRKIQLEGALLNIDLYPNGVIYKGVYRLDTEDNERK